jgi:hypothetical protein
MSVKIDSYEFVGEQIEEIYKQDCPGKRTCPEKRTASD